MCPRNQNKKTRIFISKYTGLKIKEYLPTLTYPYEYTTIGLEGLNFRIRNGNGCDPFSMDTPKAKNLCNNKELASTRSQWGLGKILPQVLGVTTSECF